MDSYVVDDCSTLLPLLLATDDGNRADSEKKYPLALSITSSNFIMLYLSYCKGSCDADDVMYTYHIDGFVKAIKLIL